jgi:hypothetical protein
MKASEIAGSVEECSFDTRNTAAEQSSYTSAFASLVTFNSSLIVVIFIFGDRFDGVIGAQE